jgi:hypothetical protein
MMNKNLTEFRHHVRNQRRWLPAITCMEVGTTTDVQNPDVEMIRDKGSRPNFNICKEISVVLRAAKGRLGETPRVQCREKIQPIFVHVVIRITELIARSVIYK